MNELFTKEGHISPLGMEALILGLLSEEGNLAAAEHISKCDKCMERFISAHSEELPAREKELDLAMEKELLRRGRLIKLKKSATICAAVVIMLVLFGLGAFSADFYPTKMVSKGTLAAIEIYSDATDSVIMAQEAFEDAMWEKEMEKLREQNEKYKEEAQKEFPAKRNDAVKEI